MATRKMSAVPVISLLRTCWLSLLVGLRFTTSTAFAGLYTLRKALRWVEWKAFTTGSWRVPTSKRSQAAGLAKRCWQCPEDLTEEQREAMANLQTIGYLEGYEPAMSSMGVTFHVR